MPMEKSAADFFAGIGLASAGLMKQAWQVKYALDHSETKQRMYEANFGSGHFHRKDIKETHGSNLPKVTLAHASFPCTDMSVAGSRGGIDVGESSAFWEFVRIVGEMNRPDGPGKPPLVLVENVEGLLTSGGGVDLKSILKSLNVLGYATDMLLINASHFVPQSRARLFIIGVLGLPGASLDGLAERLAKSKTVRPEKIRAFVLSHPTIRWCLRDLPDLPQRTLSLEDIIDSSAEWWPQDRTDYLLSQMFDRHKELVSRLKQNEKWSYGTVFRRMRSRNGAKLSTAELRVDGIAGCLRTPKGGSARQIIVRAGKDRFEARLLNARENARLMGADDFAIAPNTSLNDALFGFGDAVCVPVIEWIAKHYLNPLTTEYEFILENTKCSAASARSVSDGR